MGAIEKTATLRGHSLQLAFRELQESEREELGDDIYSGGWNNSSGVEEVSAEVYDKQLEEGFNKYEPAYAKCTSKPVRNTNKVKTTVTNFPNKGTRKWVTKYVATNDNWQRSHYVNICEDSQAECIRKARAYVEKNPNERLTINIEKHLVGDNTKVATIDYKKSSTERDGTWEVSGCMSY